MSSLRDQLLKAGVASKQQHQKARAQKKQQREKGKQPADDQRQRLQQERLLQAGRDRELNLRRQQQLAEKEQQAQLRQTLQHHAVQRDKGERAYNFIDQNRVKKWYLSDKQAEQLACGQLALARRDEGDYILIPGVIAARLDEKGFDCLLVYNPQGRSNSGDEIDPFYQDYQVPDDLVW
ncbi:MAG: DUF2058 family protein [Kistimonas sp.]|nr:DUF2058 family protein [Kistimonas sp.]